MNVVMTADGGLIETQATAEKGSFSRAQLNGAHRSGRSGPQGDLRRAARGAGNREQGIGNREQARASDAKPSSERMRVFSAPFPAMPDARKNPAEKCDFHVGHSCSLSSLFPVPCSLLPVHRALLALRHPAYTRSFNPNSASGAFMPALTRRHVLALLLAAPAAARAFAEDDLRRLARSLRRQDPQRMEGQRARRHLQRRQGESDAGQIQVHGQRSHLFYTGAAHNADFKNFEFSADVMTRPGANSGIYFHTAFQPTGFPAAGFEVQVANTYKGDNKKTGSLYAVRNVYKQLVNDNEWFTMNILVRGKQVQIRLNNMLVVDYIEPDQPFRADPNFQRVLNHGTFALQGHDPGQHHVLQEHPRPPAARQPAQLPRTNSPWSTTSTAKPCASARRTIRWSTTTCT